MNRSLTIGSALAGLTAIMALVGLVWTPWDPAALDIAGRLAAPSLRHWLGTDQLGRDVLSAIMAAAPGSLGLALGAIVLAAVVGIPLGLAASSARGWRDEVIMRGTDVLFAFPGLLMAIILGALIGPGAFDALLAIALFNVPVFARVTRAAALPVWTREFIAAARLAGRSRLAIALAHVLPNIAPRLIVQASIQCALALLAEAGLSFAGLGVQPPTPSWGRMLADAETLMASAPRLAIVPGLVLVMAVAGFMLLGDGLARSERR